MSRIGKRSIEIPSGVTISIGGNVFTAKSSKGQLLVPFSEKMSINVEGNIVTVTPSVDEKKIGAIWGLTRALINNAVKGVDTGWEKILEVRGVGYKAVVKDNTLDLQVGHSHPILVSPPEGISFAVAIENIEGENVQVIRVKGIDKQLVGDICADIRKFRPPEPYKGKGIRYRGEYVRRKAGKATGK